VEEQEGEAVRGRDERKEGKHHKHKGRTKKPRDRTARTRQAGNTVNRKKESPSSSSKEAYRRCYLFLSWPHLLSIPPFYTLTLSIHVFHATHIHPSFLPSFNIVTNHLHHQCKHLKSHI